MAPPHNSNNDLYDNGGKVAKAGAPTVNLTGQRKSKTDPRDGRLIKDQDLDELNKVDIEWDLKYFDKMFAFKVYL